MPDSALPGRINLIAAMTRNRVIGRGNAMPWHLPEDLRRFRQLTLGHPVIMGRKTHESIGRPLPGRENIVISRRSDRVLPGIRLAGSLEEALGDAQAKPVFVIGGGEIYRLAMPFADRIHLTEIAIEIDGDAHFPEIDPSEWMEIARETSSPDATLPHVFITYARRSPRT